MSIKRYSYNEASVVMDDNNGYVIAGKTVTHTISSLSKGDLISCAKALMEPDTHPDALRLYRHWIDHAEAIYINGEEYTIVPLIKPVPLEELIAIRKQGPAYCGGEGLPSHTLNDYSELFAQSGYFADEHLEISGDHINQALAEHLALTNRAKDLPIQDWADFVKNDVSPRHRE